MKTLFPCEVWYESFTEAELIQLVYIVIMYLPILKDLSLLPFLKSTYFISDIKLWI